MKRLLTAASLAGALVASVAAPAAAGPVEDASCWVQDRIGVEYVQECGAGNPDS